MIDTHVHIGYHFGKDGRCAESRRDAAEMALYAAENAWVTLINGFTTVQSVGARERQGAARCHRPRRAARAAHSHVARLDERAHRRRPDVLREYVRKQKAGRRRSHQDLRVEEHP